MILYYLAISFLVAHELDAVTHAEWRLLFVLRDLADPTAAQVFVALHVPMMFAILWLSHHANRTIAHRTRVVFSAFLILHAVVHFAMSETPEYDFHGILSRVLILFSALFGAAYLVTSSRSRNQEG